MNDMRLQPPATGEAFDNLINKLSPFFLGVQDPPWKYGRSGQAQFGVDHYHQVSGKAVQSKNLASMTYAVVLEELAKTHKFEHPISQYYIACTTLTDRALQDQVIHLNTARRAQNLFLVEIVFWDRLTEILNTYPGLREDYTGVPGINAHLVSLGQALQDRPMGSANDAKALLNRFFPPEPFLGFLFDYDFSTGRVPENKYETVQYVTQMLQDVELYKSYEILYPHAKEVAEYRLRESDWWEAWQWLKPLLPYLQAFCRSIRSQASSVETEEGVVMSLYLSHEQYHPSMARITAQWTSTALELAYFYFNHFYDGERAFPPYVMSKFRPTFL